MVDVGLREELAVEVGCGLGIGRTLSCGCDSAAVPAEADGITNRGTIFDQNSVRFQIIFFPKF